MASESQMQRQQALAQSESALSRLYDGWREKLSHLLAQQETLIDFPDEVGEAASTAHVESHLDALLGEMETHLENHRGEIVQRGLTIVIAIEWLFEGMKLRLLDTAGLRETEDEIEAEGIKRALFHVKHADVALHLYEGSPPEKISDDAVMIRTKCDFDADPRSDLAISTLTGQGIDSLLSLLATRIKKLKDVTATPLTRARHRAGIEEARAYLMEARQTPFPELRGESLRLTMRALGRITDQIDVESLLDVIFGEFCIGK